MKNIVCHQSCPRPTSSVPDIVRVTKPDRGGSSSVKSGANKSIFKKKAYSGNQMLTVLAKATAREDFAVAAGGRPQHRQSEQLAVLGKKTLITGVKAESDRGARWTGKVAENIPFTVEGLLLAAVQGICEPLYSIEGKHRANPLQGVEGLDAF